MPHLPPQSQFTEPDATPSLPFIVFSHANDLIRMSTQGSVDHASLGPLHRHHHVDAISLQFNTG